MKTTTTIATLVFGLLLTTSCKKEADRTAQLKVICPSCELEYRAGGKDERLIVNGTLEQIVAVEPGSTIYVRACERNAPQGGGYVRPTRVALGTLVQVTFDRAITPDFTASNWAAVLDSVQEPDNTTFDPNDFRYRYLYKDTCAVVDVVVPEE